MKWGLPFADRSLLSDNEARNLSRKMASLGEQWADICDELEALGFGMPSATYRSAIETYGGADGAVQVRAYWQEFAKEQLAGLIGPRDVCAGVYPACSTYRSALMQALREEKAAGRLISQGEFVSNQIEPTLKRFIELPMEAGVVRSALAASNEARADAARRPGLVQEQSFAHLSGTERHKLLISRFTQGLAPAGFTFRSHGKWRISYEKPTSDGKWLFFLADWTDDEYLERGALTSQLFGLGLPSRPIRLKELPVNAVATFRADDVVPFFRLSQRFDKRSYAEFCLAVDTVSTLTNILYSRLDKILTETEGAQRVC